MNRMLVLAVCAFLSAPQVIGAQQDARTLVERVVRTAGGLEGLRARRDVEFTYITRQPDGTERVSLERYVFDGELSWGRYGEAGRTPEGVSQVTQGYDGSRTWVTHDGAPVEDPEVIRRADFSRKTNYYWFAMMFKLIDPGVNHEYLGTRTVEGVEYDVVRMTFGESVGDVQDTYVLYINPWTHLVDQFLYTVMDFGITEPSLKKVTYRNVDGLMLPVRRIYTQSNWDGDVLGDGWSEQIMQDIELDNGFEREMFERP